MTTAFGGGTPPRQNLARAGAAVLTASLIAGCGGSSSSGAAPSTSLLTSPASTSAGSASGPTGAAASTGLTLKDAWVRAADSGWSALYGTLTNATGQEITVVSARTPVAGMVQLHETVMVHGTPTMTPQPNPAHFAVPAHGAHPLVPGGDHVMLMDLKKPIKPGASVPVTLVLAGGGSVTVTAVGKAASSIGM